MHYQTYTEYLSHPVFLAIKKAVFSRARNTCEKCHREQAVDAHHKTYPQWGSFDSPGNLLALCRTCHAQIHNKEK
jgi:hypothetical protein